MTPQILLILLGITTNLSNYPPTDTVPHIEYVSHQFLVDNACFGKECKVIAWYNDMNIIYLSNSFDKDYDDYSNIQKSIVIHELVHYLQHHYGDFISDYCPDQVKRELEAYHIQNKYLLTLGPIFIQAKYFRSCKD